MTPRSFCVAGAICSMPSTSSRDLDPGVACDSTSFLVWQASEKFCWYCQRLVVTLRPFCVACAIISRPSDPTHRLGRVASDLFVALAIPKHLPWPDLHSDRLWPYRPICHPRHGFCVAGATISMPLRCCPLTLYMLVGKGRKWLTVTLCGRRNIFQCLREVLCDPMFGDTGDKMFGDTGDPTCFLCGRCTILDGSEKFLVYTFCLCGRCNIIETSEKVTVTLREFPRDTSSVLWQVPSLPPSSSVWPYTFSLCGRRNIFRCFRNIFCDSTSFLCGRCKSLATMVTLLSFCVAGAIFFDASEKFCWLWPYVLFVWHVQ